LCHQLLGVVHPAAEIPLREVDIHEHVAHEHTVLVLDHWGPRDHPNVDDVAETYGCVRLAISITGISLSSDATAH
jgi:hypothetical protein